MCEYCEQAAPLSIDGRQHWIDGVGEVPCQEAIAQQHREMTENSFKHMDG